MRTHRCLAEFRSERQHLFVNGRPVAIVRTTSTSFMTGTGLKKMQTDETFGRFVAVEIS